MGVALNAQDKLDTEKDKHLGQRSSRGKGGIKKVSYVSLREESWLSTTIGKEDPRVWYLPA